MLCSFKKPNTKRPAMTPQAPFSMIMYLFQVELHTEVEKHNIGKDGSGKASSHKAVRHSTAAVDHTNLCSNPSPVTRHVKASDYKTSVDNKDSLH